MNISIQRSFSDRMVEMEGEDPVTGHSYYSKEMISYKMKYSYRNLLEPILLKANDMVARNAKHVAAIFLAIGIVISIVFLILSGLDFNLKL